MPDDDQARQSLAGHLSIPERLHHVEHLTPGREGSAGFVLVPLHRHHKLKFVGRVINLASAGVDATAGSAVGSSAHEKSRPSKCSDKTPGPATPVVQPRPFPSLPRSTHRCLLGAGVSPAPVDYTPFGDPFGGPFGGD